MKRQKQRLTQKKVNRTERESRRESTPDRDGQEEGSQSTALHQGRNARGSNRKEQFEGAGVRIERRASNLQAQLRRRGSAKSIFKTYNLTEETFEKRRVGDIKNL